MIRTSTLLLVFCLLTVSSRAQQMWQYFDGADTIPWNSIFYSIDTTGGNVWQVGPPQKIIFNAPATVPNVMVTDTINAYPANDTSSFVIEVPLWTNWGILALEWKQKLDMDSAMDIGTIEYSGDGGATWTDIYNDPAVYNFYGFDTVNLDTNATGLGGFTGTDSTWKDIWLCFQMSWLQQFAPNDTLYFRYTIVSDSIDNQSEGWMIDNMIAHITIFHTAKGEQKGEYQKVFPSVTDGVVHIETMTFNEFHIIESIQLIDMNGRVVKEWKNCPTRYWIDISDQPNGTYSLKIQTNKQTNTFPVILQR